MPQFSLFSGPNMPTRYSDAAGVYAVASGSANTKGSWAELIASTAYDAEGVFVWTTWTDVVNEDYLVDVGVGGAGSEEVLISNIVAGNTTASRYNGPVMYWPIAVAKGQRIAVRSQCSTGGDQIWVSMLAHPTTLLTGPTGYGRVVTYGDDTSDSGGTRMVRPGSNHTKGSWIEITAATTANISALCFIIGQAQAATFSAHTHYLIDIGIGDAGNEEVLIPDQHITSNTSTDTFEPRFHGPYNVHIAEGERIAARIQAANISNPDEFDLIVYGIG